MALVCIGYGLTTDVGGRLTLARTVTRKELAAQLTLTNVYANVPNFDYTVPAGEGDAIITAVMDFNVLTAGCGTSLARLLVDGVAQNSLVIMGEEADRATVTQQWLIVKTNVAKVCQLQASKMVNAGVVVAQALHSTFMIEDVG